MEERWKALRVISGVLRVFAWIVAVIGVLTVIGTLCVGVGSGVTASSFGGSGAAALTGGIGSLFFAVIVAVYFGLTFLFLLGGAELIMLLITIEENTRRSSMTAFMPPAPYLAPPSMPMPQMMPMPSAPPSPQYGQQFPPTMPPTFPPQESQGDGRW